MKYLLGIDFGGGASKATLIDTLGNIVAENTVEYPTLYPEKAACEQAPSDWINALCENSKALIAKSGIDAEDISAIALDSATHTSLVCDGEFKPLRNAIHWTDTRSRAEADKLREELGKKYSLKHFINPILSGHCPNLSGLKIKNPKFLQRLSIFSLKRTMFATF